MGVIGGEPSARRPGSGLDLALSVATGTACLGKYAVPEPGPVLVYLAEDALPAVRERVAGVARHRGIDLGGVEVHAITVPQLRLDRESDRTRLLEATRQLRPRLLLLDPLVRLHGIDENNAGEVAALLAYFRSLQRQLGLSVVLVHHTRKNAVGGVAAGQGCRGSSDIHAFGDSNLYLRRTKDHLVLQSEHRAAAGVAAGPPPTGRDRCGDDPPGDGRRVAGWPTAPASRIACWTTWPRARCSRVRSSRESLAVKNEHLGEALETLERTGRLCHTPAGWQRVDGHLRRGVPVPPMERKGTERS